MAVMKNIPLCLKVREDILEIGMSDIKVNKIHKKWSRLSSKSDISNIKKKVEILCLMNSLSTWPQQ